jgi:hypothetical protein
MASRTLENAGAVELEGVSIIVPDVRGSVTVERGAAPTSPRAARRRTGGRATGQADPLETALRRQGMRTYRTAVIDGTRTPPRPTRRGGRPPKSEPIELNVRPPRKDRGQVVLTIENNIATWHVATESRTGAGRGERRGEGRGSARGDRGGPSGGPRRLTYLIPQVRPAPERATRGGFPISMIVRIITFPIGKVVGQAARLIARKWDADRHPPRIRAYGPDGRLTDLTAADWERLAKGRVLLFVHGTFSTTEGAFGGLPQATRQTLYDRYGGRVIAYDHPTIADDPFTNARRFFELVDGRALELDIVCHSRGGLVSRSIAERPGDLANVGPKVHVRQVVLVGVLSNGTILADATHWGELADRFTILLRLVPAPGVVDALETVLTVVKAIAMPIAQDLEGLDAMAPTSEYLQHLNTGPKKAGDPTYRVIGSNFEPSDPDLKAWLNDEIRDGLFTQLPNDMMVTINSMSAANGSGRFPIAAADCRSFEPQDAVEHANYFGQPRTSEWLLDWLRGAP